MFNLIRRSAFHLFALLLLIVVNIAAHSQVIESQVAFPNLHFLEPVGLVQPGDGSNRLFILEKAGVIRSFENSSQTATADVFLDISNRVVSTGGEQGLLGLAFDPMFRDNGFFYVYYTMENPFRTVLARYSTSIENPQVADPSSEMILITIERKTNYHNAGQLAFGPDGYLYIAVGEGGQDYAAPVKTSLLGKILRIDVSAQSEGRNYAIPPDNPYFNNSDGLQEEILAYGFRNPWRFSIDPESGVIWSADVGPENWEELNIIEKGKNYGWPRMEGNHCYPPSDSGCDQTGLTPPIWEYGHDAGVAIVGGYVYHGSRIPELKNEYICGDFGVGRIWSLKYDGTNLVSSKVLIDVGPTISSFGVDANNELYYCSLNGSIYTLVVVDTSHPQLSVGMDYPHFSMSISSAPNPFSSTISFRYDLSRPEHIRLIVRNLFGETVATLIDDYQTAGNHVVSFDGHECASGVYYCTMLGDNGAVDQERIVLVK
jgi:glucose/arabinose dehydrogenase